MISGQNIICFANDWDADPTSKHQVMRVLAQRNQVLWVNSIGLRRPGVSTQDAFRIIKKIRQFFRGAVTVHANLHVITPLVIPFHSHALARMMNARLISWYVRSQARKLGMDKFQMWIILPTAAVLISYLKPEKIVYYCVDDWSAFTFLDATLMRELEERMIPQSDLVIVSAKALYSEKRRLNPQTYFVPHGVDSEHFLKAREKDTESARELEGLSTPVIGFWGLIHEWIDLDLVVNLAKAHPEWSIVLVGEVSVDPTLLRMCSNIHCVGKHTYAALPGFAKGFTAAMLPFKINRLTQSVNPIKLREYLAAGLPVVSTALPEVQMYAGIVRIAKDHHDFVREMEHAVQDTGERAVRRRIAAVAKETWQARVEYISTLLENSGGNGR